MVYNAENGTVIYRSRMHAKTKRNFEIFSAEEFIAAITQHIPDKGFQMVRYYGWYSNRARGERAKRETEPGAPEATDVDVIDVSEYHPPRIPSKKWRELIKKVWEVDPLICPHCGAEMKLIALIDDDGVIEKILRHLKLWPEQTAPACLSRAPPPTGVDRVIPPSPVGYGGQAETFFDDPFPDYPVTTLSRGTGLTWRHRARLLVLRSLGVGGWPMRMTPTSRRRPDGVAVLSGGPSRTRTCDRLIMSQML